MNFWKSGIVRWALGAMAGVLVAEAAKLGLDLGVTADQIVEAVITVGTLVTFGVIVVKRVKIKPKEISRDTVPTPILKMAGGGKATAILLIFALSSTACAGSFVSRTNKALLGFEAAYKIEEPVRGAFCRGKVPQPEACVNAYQIALAGFTSYHALSSAFSIYLDLKADAAKVQVIRILPEVLDFTVKLAAIATELR